MSVVSLFNQSVINVELIQFNAAKCVNNKHILFSYDFTEDNSVFIQLNSGQVLFPSDSVGAIKSTTSLNVKCLLYSVIISEIY